MTQKLVRHILEARLNTWALDESFPLAWENTEYRPTAGAYGRVFLIPAPTVAPDLERVGRIYTGIFQISLVMPTGKGPAAAETKVNQLSEIFKPEEPIVGTGITVTVMEPLSAFAPIQEGDRWVVPASFPYRAQTYPT